MKDLDVDVIWKNFDGYGELVNPALGNHVFELIAGGGDGVQDHGNGYLMDQFGKRYSYRGGWAGNSLIGNSGVLKKETWWPNGGANKLK